MALIIMCVDEPLQLAEQAWDAYVEQRDGWFAAILKRPGCREIRGYMAPYYGTSPGSAAHIEFSTMEAVHSFLESDLYRKIISEARGAGCTNFRLEVWDVRPGFAEPLRPESTAE
ncbi:MAG: hypothetical protein IPK16_00360 [Anaerolineales bacterium]|nr:hypothetical protein [Anaerolineales bacterium]